MHIGIADTVEYSRSNSHDAIHPCGFAPRANIDRKPVKYSPVRPAHCTGTARREMVHAVAS